MSQKISKKELVNLIKEEVKKVVKIKSLNEEKSRIEKQIKLLKEESGNEDGLNYKFTTKQSIISALYKLLESEKIENIYTDEYWVGITKLEGVFKKHNIDYDMISADYLYDKNSNSDLPNRKVYVFNVKVNNKEGKEFILPLKVTCAFIGKTGTMADEKYELTYYFTV
jgi:hypothetical protein